MATKYRQDPYVNPECQIIYEGGPGAKEIYDNCTKNPGHERFFTLSELKPEMLPEGWRRKTVMDLIECFWNLTVKIDVKYTSKYRPSAYPGTDKLYPYSKFRGSEKKRRVGTGFVHGVYNNVVNRPCPCPECVQSGQPKGQHFIVYINTSSHVIFDDHEAKHAVFHLDFNSDEDEDKIKRIYGIKCVIQIDELDEEDINLGEDSDEKSDDTQFDSQEKEGTLIIKCLFDRTEVICVTHDKELAKSLCYLSHRRFLQQYSLFQRLKSKPVREKDMATGLVISHPHGLSKKISIGQIHHRSIPNASLMKEVLDDEDEDEDEENVLSEETKWRLPVHPEQLSESYKTKDLSVVAMPVDISQIITSASGHHCLTPGTEYMLPFEIKFDLPKNAPYYARYPFLLQSWYTFPPGTTFENNVTGEHCEFPPHAEFFPGEEEIDDDEKCYYLTYDIPTCPGSSGAGVFDLRYHSCLLIHGGTLQADVNTTINRSGVHLEEKGRNKSIYFQRLNQNPFTSKYDFLGSEDDFDKENELLTDEMLLHLYGLSVDDTKMNEGQGPTFAVYKINGRDDDFLRFTRWRVRKRLIKSILSMAKKRRTVRIPTDEEEEEQDDDDDDDDDCDKNDDDGGGRGNGIGISKIGVPLQRLAMKTQTKQVSLVKMLMMIQNDVKDDDISKTKTVVKHQMMKLFSYKYKNLLPRWLKRELDENNVDPNDMTGKFVTEKMLNLCYSHVIDAEGDDNVDEDMNNVNNTAGCTGSDSDDDKKEKKRRWSTLLEKLIDHKGERRLIELYATHIDSSISLSQNEDEEIRHRFRQKRYDSMRNRENEWRKLIKYLNKYDTFCLWEENDDADDNDDDYDDDDDDDDDDYEKTDKMLKKTRTSLRRELFDKLSSMDAGELDWKEIRCWETVVSPTQCPEESQKNGLAMTFLMDEKFQRAARYVLGVDDVSLPLARNDGGLDNSNYSNSNMSKMNLEERFDALTDSDDGECPTDSRSKLRTTLISSDTTPYYRWKLIFHFMSCMPDFSFRFIENIFPKLVP